MSKNNKSIKETIATNRTEAICICLVFLFYIFMMMFRLTYSPLWFDEHIEHLISQMSLTNGEMYQNIIITFQPPLYNFIMHFWLMLGTGDFWFRFFNVVLGVFTGLSIYLTVRRLYGFKVATFSLALLACCYQYIYCVQECSEYQLMVMNISLMIYYYVRLGQERALLPLSQDRASSGQNRALLPCENSLISGAISWKKFILHSFLFIFFAVCAMYSQYGAMFMVIPFLALYWFQIVFTKDKRNIISTTVMYGIAAVAGALPLYLLYASKQLAENGIAENAGVKFGLSELLGLFTEPGKIAAYLYNIPMKSIINLFLGIAGVLFLIVTVLIIIGKIKLIKSTASANSSASSVSGPGTLSESVLTNANRGIVASLLGILLAGYVMHYFLVVFHIYAMIHPGESGGFYARYSYFCIPLTVISITIVAIELKRFLIDNRIADIGSSLTVKKANLVLCGLFAAVALLIFVPRIMRNWHKSYDDLFVATWVTEKGWEEQTYLTGQARFGFKRYVTDVYGEATGYNAFHESQVNLDWLPDRFWIWGMSWGNDKFDEIVNGARERGYNVEILYDFGTEGTLAHATK